MSASKPFFTVTQFYCPWGKFLSLSSRTNWSKDNLTRSLSLDLNPCPWASSLCPCPQDQFTSTCPWASSPCPCTWTSSPCPWASSSCPCPRGPIYKSLSLSLKFLYLDIKSLSLSSSHKSLNPSLHITISECSVTVYCFVQQITQSNTVGRWTLCCVFS